jgi:hypothetical protein
MKRMPFEPPTDYYDNKIEAIDEEIVQLIKQRKEISKYNPGFPSRQLISYWSKKFNFYEDFLNSVFSHFLNEEIYKPVVEPQGFLRNIPILKSFEKNEVFYSVSFVRQFENASVVHFNIDRISTDELAEVYRRDHTYFELSIKGDGIEYDCRNDRGRGSGGHESYTFIVSPALPDDKTKYKLVFKEYKVPFQKKTDFEFVI